ncbi:hypothetical protein [Aedoeadaptatus coli]|uniref:hypothetical protein n=1 Tax=Aedoeadaptatus coli TaxID=2058292 RepID=UPI000D54CD14|nr:hypothetical protein [Peptoniphilus coli]
MTKEELKSILYLDQLINSKLRQLDQLKAYRARLPAGSSDTGPVQSGVSDPTASLATKITDLDRSINDEIDKLVELKESARVLFCRLDCDLRLKLIMELRYLECLDWRGVAARSGYNPRHVYKLHGRALEILFKDGT